MEESVDQLNYYSILCSQKTLQSKPEGFFTELLKRVTPSIDFRVLSSCSTDKARIRYCTSCCWNIVGAELIFRGKNEEDSIEKRLLGNEAFEKGNLRQALCFYSQSVIRAPADGLQLALVYSNRSALLQKLGHKLYERMTACYVSLSNFTKAKVTLSQARHLADKNAAGDGKFLKKLCKLQELIETKVKVAADPNSIKENPQTKTKALEQKSLKFPVASTKFNVEYNQNMGRYAVATKPITTGEEILREEPYARCVAPEKMGTHCLHCFKRLQACIPCETCANVAFCSLHCRQKANTYHQYECRVLALFCGAGISLMTHLALRIVTQRSAIDYIQEFANLQSKPSELLTDPDEGTFDSMSYANVFNLSALENERKPEDFIERCIMTVFLMKCLRLVGYFNINLFMNPQPTEDELTIGAILLRNLQVLQFNAYEITELVLDSKENLHRAKSQSIGLAVYNTASFFNHSCAPNVSRYFDGTSMVIESIQPIGKGDAIVDSYGPTFTKISTSKRQIILKGRYWFSCACQACVEMWPLLNMMEPLEGKNKSETQIISQLKKLDDMYFEKGVQLMERGQGLMAAEFLKKYVDLSTHLMDKLNAARIEALSSNDHTKTKIHFKSFYMAQEALKLCIASKGSVHLLETK